MDHFAKHEKEAYECTRNIISTLNFELPQEEDEQRWKAEEEPLYGCEELLQLAPLNYNHSLDVRMVSDNPQRSPLFKTQSDIMFGLRTLQMCPGPNSHACDVDVFLLFARLGH